LKLISQQYKIAVVGEKDGDERATKLFAPDGKVTLQLNELEKNIEGTDSVLASGDLTTADVFIFAAFGWFASGFMTKITSVENLLKNRPKLAAIVDRVGAMPEVKAYYSLEAKKAQPMAQVYQQFSKL
jgi:glutathione S-transferase